MVSLREVDLASPSPRYNSQAMTHINGNVGERGTTLFTQEGRWAVVPCGRTFAGPQDGNESFSSCLRSYNHQCEVCGAKPKRTPEMGPTVYHLCQEWQRWYSPGMTGQGLTSGGT